MLNKDYTAKLLDLEDVIVTNVENISEEVHVSLELPRMKHRCPACDALTDRVHDYRMQIQGCSAWQDNAAASAQAALPLRLRQALLREKHLPSQVLPLYQPTGGPDHHRIPRNSACFKNRHAV